MNLCTNAHHAMKENGGVLTIGLDRIEPDMSAETRDESLNKDQRHLKITISDSGCGMDEATLKRIFDPYFTTKTKDMGTGLGLSVVRKIVDDCKGQISVFSLPGHGTRFELLFPEAGNIEKEQHTPALEISKGSGNILFVDDEIDIANLGVTLLERLGYKVVASTQPLDALEQIKAAPQSFDMVITDMTMPKMTGTRLAEAIKNIRPDLPIILCTGFSRSELPEGAEARIIDAILKKPVDLRDFSETIGRLLIKKVLPGALPPVQNVPRPFFL
jgi:CheY-like chemotaxis protein